MNEAIKRGMYGGELPAAKAISTNARTMIIEVEGNRIEVSTPDHVRYLEEQLLAVRKQLAIRESEDKKRDAVIKRLTTALKKLDAKIS